MLVKSPAEQGQRTIAPIYVPESLYGQPETSGAVIFAANLGRLTVDAFQAPLFNLAGMTIGGAMDVQPGQLWDFRQVDTIGPRVILVGTSGSADKDDAHLMLTLRENAPEAKFLAVSSIDVRYPEERESEIGAHIDHMLLDAGAEGIISTRNHGERDLVRAVERVYNDEIVVNVIPPGQLPAKKKVEADPYVRLANNLTHREREALLCLVGGLDTPTMVDRMGVSKTTVRTHLQAVLTKLGVHSRLEAATFADKYGLPDLWANEFPDIAASMLSD
jgi:DNA-binding NarL/FixJ family response regulator